MTIITISKNKKIIVSITAIFLFCLGYYLSVYDSFAYQSNNFTIGSLMMATSFFAFPVLWLDLGENPKSKNYTIIIPTIIFLFCIIFLLTNNKKKYLVEELNKYGIIATAKVTGSEFENHKSGRKYFATFKYKTNGKEFVQRIENYKEEYKEGEILKILVSKRNPEMFEIVE